VEIEQDVKKRNEYIDIIQSETGKINTLVLAMLEYSKLESDGSSYSIIVNSHIKNEEENKLIKDMT